MTGAERRADPWVMGTAAVLVGLGLVLVYSSATPRAFGAGAQDPLFFAKRSAGYAGVGLLAMAGMSRVPTGWLRPLAYPVLALSVGLLALCWVPGFGQEVNGAHRWVRLGPVGFQPSEIAKFAVILFLADSLARRGDRLRSFAYGYLPHVLIPAVPVALILAEPDLGTAAVVAAVVFLVCFVAGVRPAHLVSGLLPAVPIAVWALWFVPFRRARILAFLDPWKYAQDEGFQLVQSLLAFGMGGLWGVGLGRGQQKLFYLPEAHTDFILSVWAEEAGFVGVAVVLALVAFLVARGCWIAARQADPYRRYLALGITTWLGLQAGLNALVVTGCLPTKGLPFPFLSYGGTGWVVDLAAVGVLAGTARCDS
ncbi:MAG: putative lipid II flippase FtsW [Candidatus Dadabacteria bacterium]|nr:MAG: putative lipid II flippase FtsW [Candidatus Dadabacteria bacterium]